MEKRNESKEWNRNGSLCVYLPMISFVENELVGKIWCLFKWNFTDYGVIFWRNDCPNDFFLI